MECWGVPAARDHVVLAGVPPAIPVLVSTANHAKANGMKPWSDTHISEQLATQAPWVVGGQSPALCGSPLPGAYGLRPAQYTGVVLSWSAVDYPQHLAGGLAVDSTAAVLLLLLRLLLAGLHPVGCIPSYPPKHIGHSGAVVALAGWAVMQ